MGEFFLLPTPERVKDACDKFDEEYKTIEGALTELFGHFPSNSNRSHVLLKVVALNRLYSAGVLAVEAVAMNISEHGMEIDLALEAGMPSVVKRIAEVRIQGREFNFFSFASKYCSWHKPDRYPVYDSRVDRYLWSLQNHSSFSDIEHRSDICKTYEGFLKIMNDFQRFYKLDSFNFKEIDKFLWSGTTFREKAPEEVGVESSTLPTDSVSARP
jgi:hypothetical protein